jgi:hypothetical protein
VSDLSRSDLWDLVDNLEPSAAESRELAVERLMAGGLDRDEAELMVAAREAKGDET